MTVRFRRTAVTLVFGASFLTSVAPMAVAGPIVLETSVVANTGCTPNVDCKDADDPFNFELWGPVPGISGSQGSGFVELSGTFGSAFLSSSAAANAAPGALNTRGAVSYDLSSPGYRFVAGNAQVIDRLTITANGIAPGTAGLLDTSFTLDGTITKSGTGDAATIFAVQWGGNAPFDQADGQGFVKSSSTAETFSVNAIPFVFGQPFYFSLFMASGAGTIRACPACDEGIEIFQATGAGGGSADFFNTLLLSGLTPTDLQGNPIANPLFASDSGAQYTVNGVTAVPEPGTLILLGSGVAMLLRRRSKNPRS